MKTTWISAWTLFGLVACGTDSIVVGDNTLGSGGTGGVGGMSSGTAQTPGSTGGQGGATSSSTASTKTGPRLPKSNEVGSWQMIGQPREATTDTALYDLMDGAAPKYIERGWVSSILASYVQSPDAGPDSVEVVVAIHTMMSTDFAQSIYAFDLSPSRMQILNSEDIYVSLDRSDSYEVRGYVGQFYVELTIFDRSDAALVIIKEFARVVFGKP